MEVASIDGQPRIGSTPLAGAGRIAVGQTLSTDEIVARAHGRRHIGHVTVDPDTRMRLVDTRDTRHQLALDRGTLHAFIVAPPGQFIVDTPSATATDLGCVYDLYVDEDGSGLLTVVAGWVAFEDNGRESFVPAGASARTDRSNGPGTPRYNDRAGVSGCAGRVRLRRLARRQATRSASCSSAAAGDAMTLWHLISRVPPADRAAVVDALARSSRCRRRDARRGLRRQAALDQWWDALGLRDTGWWRTWKTTVP